MGLHNPLGTAMVALAVVATIVAVVEATAAVVAMGTIAMAKALQEVAAMARLPITEPQTPPLPEMKMPPRYVSGSETGMLRWK